MQEIKRIMNAPKRITTRVSEEDIANGVSDEYGVLYSQDNKRLLRCENKNITEYTIRDGIRAICKNAFNGCRSLNRIIIPNSVIAIGSSAFRNCTGLEQVTIGEGVILIGSYTFYGCMGLTELTIPESVISIGSEAFAWCTGLTSLTIGESVTVINICAFDHCMGLTEVNFNATACISTGPNYYRAFNCCCNISKVAFGDNVTMIPAYLCCDLTKLKEITIPESVKEIGSSAFEWCTGLTEVTIPNSVAEIGSSAFEWCTGLTGTLNIPSGVTSIGNYAFRDCASLSQLTIGESVTKIGEEAFENCNMLNSVTSLNPEPPMCASGLLGCDVFYNVPIKNCVLYVPKGSLKAYSKASPWRSFGLIVKREDGNP